MDHAALQRDQRKRVRLESLGRFWYFRVKMPRSKQNPRSTDQLSLRQRQRRRQSRMNSRPVARRTPSENLKLALELSDLCFALRDAGGPQDLLDVKKLLTVGPSGVDLERLKKSVQRLRLGKKLGKCLREIDRKR
jgi:hypothetical protein